MMRTRLSRTTGFSLIELMIVLVILAILAAIAIPAYQKYVLRSHRVEATKTLQDIAGREENYFYTNNGYIIATDAGSLSSLGLTTAYLQQAAPDYTIAIGSVDGTSATYSLSATATGNQAADTDCSSFTLTNTGLHTSNGAATTDANNCWQSH